MHRISTGLGLQYQVKVSIATSFQPLFSVHLQNVSQNRHIDLEHDSSLLDLVLTHHCEDLTDFQHLSHWWLVIMLCLNLNFGHMTYNLYLVPPVPIPGELIFRQSETMLSRLGRSIDDEWNRFRATIESATSSFIPWSRRKPSHCPPWVVKETRNLLKRRKHFEDLFLSKAYESS